MANEEIETTVIKEKAKKGRGRPVLYKGKKFLSHIASLVKNYGATGARNILNATEGSELATKRSAKMIPAALGISLPTILKIAKEQGVSLKRGRRMSVKAA